MPSLTLPDRLIWFAHCPKAGGTSVEKVMVDRWGAAVGHLFWGWDLWWRAGGWRLADPPNSPQHLVWEDALAMLPHPPDTVFALVRDPVLRMASEHRWQRRGRRGTWLGRALAELPFPFWLRLMLAVRRHNPHAFDNHFRAQADFVPEGARIFRLEDGLEPALDWLAETTGWVRTEPAPHAIATGGNPSVAAAEAALIGRVFAEDYRRFGYPSPAPHRCRGWRDRVAETLAGPVAWLERRGRI